ncbi:MAG: Flagellar motor switch protein FliM [Syntrophus sp. PtaB.Bin001]|nr:MAG: Flagellar motor switch protein FliM [Syntrophus sp. PtaB.Bin001]
MAADLDILIELGNTQISAKDAINLKLGDVITLDKYCTDPVNIFVEGIMKFKGYPGIYKGNQAVKISEIIQEKEVCEYGTE